MIHNNWHGNPNQWLSRCFCQCQRLPCWCCWCWDANVKSVTLRCWNFTFKVHATSYITKPLIIRKHQVQWKLEMLEHIRFFFLLESIIVYFGYYYICNNDNRWFFFFVHLPSCFWPNWVVEWELGGRKMDGLRGERKKRFFQREKPIVLHQYFFNNYFPLSKFFNIM